MLSGLWGSASNAIASAADRLDSIGAAIKDTLAEDTTDHDFQSEAEDLEEYKKMLNDLEFKQVELSKQSRLALAHKEAEIEMYKMKLKEFLPDDESLEQVKVSSAVSLDNAKMKAENNVLEETVATLQLQLQGLLEVVNEARMKDNKLREMEKKYTRVVKEYGDRIHELEISETHKGDTIEELVAEYSKLAAEAEQQKTTDKSKVMDISKSNEVLSTKVRALEQVVSDIADRSTATAAVPQNNSNELKELKTKNESLAKALSGKEEELTKAASNYNHVREELMRIRDQPPPPAPPNTPSASDVTDSDEFKMAIKALKTAEQSVAELREALAREVSSKAAAATLLEVCQKEHAETVKTLNDKIEAFHLTSNGSNNALEVLEAEKKDLASALKASNDALTRAEADFTIRLEQSERAQASVAAIAMEANGRQSEASAADMAGVKASLEAAFAARLSECQAAAEAAKETAVSAALSGAEITKASALAALREEESEKMKKALTDLEDKLALAKASALEAAAVAAGAALEEALQKEAAKAKEDLEAMRLSMSSAIVAAEKERDQAKHDLTAAEEVCRKTKEDASTTLQAQKEAEVGRAAADATAAEAAKEAAVSAALSNAEITKASALAALREEESEKMKKGLTDLEDKLALAKASALEAAAVAAGAALEEALQKEAAKAKEDLEAMRLSMSSAIAAAEKERDQAKHDLITVEERWVKMKEEALAAMHSQKEAEKERALADVKAEYKALIDTANAEKQEYLDLYSKENKARKAIHNKLLEMQGNIRVVCRVRPILEVERRSGEDVDVTTFPSDEDITIQRDVMTKAKYEYDRVFPPSSVQSQVFESVQPVCVSVLDGYNVCIFAYGQTGSGKTYTMEGYGADKGVSPKAIDEIFRLVGTLENDWTYTLSFSMLEIYNETIRDLLVIPEKDKKFSDKEETNKLDIRQTPEGNVVPGLTEVQVMEPGAVLELMLRGNSNRAVGSHDMNEHSSRSHSILSLVCRGKSKRDGSSTFGKLNLIDLAGSERVGKTDATGERLKEAQNINRSLSALGDVINALGNKKSTHIPYRNSKLTFLLQDSLGGNSKCLMFVNISPAVYNLGETICSLNFASRCRNVELGQAKKQADDKPVSKAGSSESLATPARRAVGTLPTTGGMSALRK